mmetsp:Transcript_79584/g.165288  ORF Transcript_79584/g.165288 Transcript_79584/m.165288 type:complete len:223 (-) Transcript_79584:357-1025(-)
MQQQQRLQRELARHHQGLARLLPKPRARQKPKRRLPPKKHSGKKAPPEAQVLPPRQQGTKQPRDQDLPKLLQQQHQPQKQLEPPQHHQHHRHRHRRHRSRSPESRARRKPVPRESRSRAMAAMTTLLMTMTKRKRKLRRARRTKRTKRATTTTIPRSGSRASLAPSTKRPPRSSLPHQRSGSLEFCSPGACLHCHAPWVLPQAVWGPPIGNPIERNSPPSSS